MYACMYEERGREERDTNKTSCQSGSNGGILGQIITNLCTDPEDRIDS